MIIRRPSCGAFSTGWSQRTFSNYKVARTRSDRHENWKQNGGPRERKRRYRSAVRVAGESGQIGTVWSAHNRDTELMRIKRQILAMH